MELKQAICDHHKRLYGTSYTLKECIANMGGKHAIFNLTQALLDPGDEVIIPVPYWVTYQGCGELRRRQVRLRRNR